MAMNEERRCAMEAAILRYVEGRHGHSGRVVRHSMGAQEGCALIEYQKNAVVRECVIIRARTEAGVRVADVEAASGLPGITRVPPVWFLREVRRQAAATGDTALDEWATAVEAASQFVTGKGAHTVHVLPSSALSRGYGIREYQNGSNGIKEVYGNGAVSSMSQPGTMGVLTSNVGDWETVADAEDAARTGVRVVVA